MKREENKKFLLNYDIIYKNNITLLDTGGDSR